MLFSQRQGLTPSLKELQTGGMDDELRMRLWNALAFCYWDKYKRGRVRYFGDVGMEGSNMEGFIFVLWHSFFKWSVEDRPNSFFQVRQIIHAQFFNFQWFRVYDFIEFVLANSDYDFAKNFPSMCNSILEEENAGYRILNGRVTEITSPVEIQAVEEALAQAEAFPGVRAHLTAALRMLSDREQPDYRNSIKESISAVESVCRVLTGSRNATLGSALNVLERHTHLHGALKAGFSKLYGYTSDADGIRHAMLEEPSISFTDAKFMLVACSGFVNYLIGKVAELQIALPSDTQPTAEDYSLFR